MSITSVQIDSDLMEKVMKIAQNKWPLRKISKYAETTREVFFDFIKRNKKFLHQIKNVEKKAFSQDQEEQIEST